MTTEEILKEIEELTKLNREYRSRVNQVLNEASGAIKHVDKALKEEYERGVKDAWDLACKLESFNTNQLVKIFGYNCVSDILSYHTYYEIKNMIEEYENKKEIEESIVRGDEVKVVGIGGTVFNGIFIGEDPSGSHCWVIGYDTNLPQALNKNIWVMSKTGKHVDLDWIN